MSETAVCTYEIPSASAVNEAALEAVGARRADPVGSLPVGRAAIGELGNALPEATLMALAAVDSWILGPHDKIREEKLRTASQALE